jgi:PAS domain S-box-containing protein
MFILLCIFTWLNEILDLPHLLLGAPGTPVNWRESLIETVLIAAVGFFAVSRLIRDIAERQRAEEALRESKEKYQMLFETAKDAIFLSDETGKFVDVNQAACESLGYSKEELLRLSNREIDADPRGYEAFLQVRNGPMRESTFKVNQRRKNGTLLPVEIIGSFFTSGGQRISLAIARDITERKQAEEALRRRTAQLEALRQVELELAAQLDLDTLLHFIVSRAVELLEGTTGGLYLYRPKRDLLEWVVAVGSDVAPIGTILHRGEGLSGKVWESGEPLIVNDYQHWKGRAVAWESYPTPVVVGVPVRWGEEFLGVLNVASDSPRAFSPADAELLNLFATQAAIAIRNARLYEAERKRATQLAVVNQVAQKAASILDPDHLLREIVAAIQQGFGYYNVVILQLDETNRELGRQAMAGGFEDIAAPDYHQAVGVGMIGWTAETGQPLLANDVSQEPRYIPGFLKEVLTKSELCVPLKLAGRVIGVLDIQDTRLNAFDETDLVAMETLADQIAIALENARLYEEAQRELAERKRAEETLRRRNRELALLNRASQAFTSTLDLDQVLVNVLEEIRRLLDVSASSVWLIDRETGELVCQQATGSQSETVRGWRLSPGQGLAGWVARTGESLIVPDTRANEHYFKGVDQQTGLPLRSVLAVPLRVRDSVIGVAQVVDTEVDRFQPTDLRLVESLATPAAIAIENAQLYEQARRDTETKSVLIDEINHRVKNNISTIIGLLYAEQRYAKAEAQAAYQSIIGDMVNRLHGLATVHSMLSASEWAPLRLNELASQIIRSSWQTLPHDRHLSVDVAPSPVMVTADQAHNLALVINELATNTIKHTMQRDTSQITVRIGLDGDKILFEFRDDGPGYPEDVLHLERYSAGLDLVQNIVRKSLRGELSLHNDRGAVTTIQITAEAE